MWVLVLWAEPSSGEPRRAGTGRDGGASARAWPQAEIVHQDFGSRIEQLPVGSWRSLVRERIVGTRGASAWISNFDLVIDTRSGDSCQRHLWTTSTRVDVRSP